MEPLDRHIRRHGFFLRRRDLLANGFNDHAIRASLKARRTFRVRQGWYSVPDAPADAVRAVRVGGRLTSVSALASYGLRVPRRDTVHIAVARTGSRLRDPNNKDRRLSATDSARVHWGDARGSEGSAWRVSIDEALLAILRAESRFVVVACCSAVMRHRMMSVTRLDEVFRRGPKRVQPWRELVSALDDSHGETLARLGFLDAGMPFEQQARFPGVGRIDFRMSPHTYVEVDGGQHDPAWTGGGTSRYESDHDRDATVAIAGGTTNRYTYRQLYGDWPRVVAAIERTAADDRALSAYRRRHPYRPAVSAQRRRSQKKQPL
ncbi:MAG: hypothetical protein JWP30_2030 [Homoserinimonas sp.]|jgi:very-short-patch-repair endonuclease|nr:hypothetical protein [Mycetocola sp.]MCU1546930.1 hypothetical protein [Homoserinimonas sp.]